MFFSNLFAPWKETFADAGDVDGGGNHLGPVSDKRNVFGIRFFSFKKNKKQIYISKYVHIYRKRH